LEKELAQGVPGCPRMKVLLVFGTRPEAIKIAPILHAGKRERSLDLRVCVTGQHQEIVNQALDFFEIEPDYRLDVMRPNQDLSSLTSRILDTIRPVLIREQADMVLVQGDTTTAFASSLAAFYERIPVAHVEAGLRTSDLSSPFPEEGMRQLVTRLANLHFAPTERNRATLLSEGIADSQVFVTGNTVVDAMHWARRKSSRQTFPDDEKQRSEVWWKRIFAASRIALVTAHRRESFGEGLNSICSALKQLAHQHQDLLIVFPVHPNPNVRGPVESLLSDRENILLVPPLHYPDFVLLMDRSTLIITDSGGVQEEATALGKHLLLTRDCTERQEAVDSGNVQIVGADRDRLLQAANRMLRDCSDKGNRRPAAINPYGDGHAADKIVRILAEQGRAKRSGVAAPRQLSAVSA
jgi:UDP-N-acetylglucosamine 2-epimerase (non-hydrolysing)